MFAPDSSRETLGGHCFRQRISQLPCSDIALFCSNITSDQHPTNTAGHIHQSLTCPLQFGRYAYIDDGRLLLVQQDQAPMLAPFIQIHCTERLHTCH